MNHSTKVNNIQIPNEHISAYFDIFIIKYLPKIFIAIAILTLGYFIAKLVKKIVAKHLSKTNPVAQNFVSNTAYVFVFLSFLIMALAKTGMNTSSLVAVVGSAGIAIGLAFQPSLSNISSGLMIVLFKPFKINDYIEADGITGNVKQIGLYNTWLIKADNTLIIVPNSRVMSTSLVNFSDQQIRRVDIEIIVEHSQDISQLRSLAMDVIFNDSRVLNYPTPAVIVKSFTNNGLLISIRSWTSYTTYWDLLYDLQEEIQKIYTKNNVKFATQPYFTANNTNAKELKQ